MAIEPKDDANIQSLISARMDLNRIYTKLRGDTVEYDDIVNTTATSFTELISDDIQSVASENQEAWAAAMMACTCAHGVIDAWIEAIRAYRDKIEDLSDEYDEAVKNAEDSDDDAGSEQIEAASAAYEELERDADSCETMLSEGPTPETVRKLIEGGHLGFAPFAITGDFEYYPYDAEGGEDLAGRIREGNFGGDYEELHDAAHELAQRAAQAAEDGKELSDGELDFLEAVLGGTDEILLGVPESLQVHDESEGYRGEIAAMLGMAIAGVSHEKTGGGHDRLPDSVRNLSDGVREGEGYFTGGPRRSGAGYGTWLEEAEALTYLLDKARHPNGSPMELGEETSLKLTSAVSEVAGALPSEHDGNQLNITYSPDEQENSTMSSLLNFSSANEDANHELLTEGGQYNGRNRAEIISDLYAFDWDDDGRAAAGLTDWIAEGEDSTDSAEPDRARDALAGLMDIMSSESMQENLSRTGHEVEDTMTVFDADGESRTEEFEWKDVSIGHLNPEIASGFADVFDAHIGAFASLEGMTERGNAISGFDNVYEEGELKLNRNSREAFAEIIAGSEEAAGQMFESTVEYNESSLEEYMSRFDGAPEPEIPQQAGNLWNIVDNAVSSEAGNRVENHNNQVDEENKRNQFALSLVNSYNPSPQASAAVDFVGGELLNQDHLNDDDGDRGDGLPRNAWLYERAQIHSIDALAERGEGYEDLVDPRMTPNDSKVSLERDHWLEFDEDQEREYLEERGREPSNDPLNDTWKDLRSLEWPNDLDPEQVPERSEAIEEREEAIDTPRTYVNDYVDAFQNYATD